MTIDATHTDAIRMCARATMSQSWPGAMAHHMHQVGQKALAAADLLEAKAETAEYDRYLIRIARAVIARAEHWEDEPEEIRFLFRDLFKAGDKE